MNRIFLIPLELPFLLLFVLFSLLTTHSFPVYCKSTQGESFPHKLEDDFFFSASLLPFLVPFKILEWFEFTVFIGNYSHSNEVDLYWNWSADEKFESMRAYYAAEIEIADLWSSSSQSYSFIEALLLPSPNQMYSSSSKSHFVCFVDPNEFRLLISKIPNFLSHSWLIIIPFSEDSISILLEWSRLFETLHLSIDTDFYLAIQTGSSSTVEVYEFYQICPVCVFKSLKICKVFANNSIDGDLCSTDKFQRRKDLEGIILNAVGVDVQPYIAKYSTRADGKSFLSGGSYAEIFLTMARDSNFTYSLRVLNGYKYGSFVNGSWNGMIGHLSRNEDDLTVSEISLAYDRLEFMDYTMSFETIGRRIYILKVLEEKKINWKFYTGQFSLFLHLSLITCSVILALFLWTFVNFWHDEKGKLNFYETVWLILSSICQKGAYIVPTGQSAKIIFIVTYLTFGIVFSCYSATLTSQLAIAPPIKLPFKNLAGLIKAKKWFGGPIRGGLAHIYMEKTCPAILSTNGSGSNIQCQQLTEMWNKVVRRDATKLPTTFEEGLQKVLQQKFAFFGPSSGTRYRINTYLSESDSCRVHEMSEDYISSNLAFGLRRNNPFKRLINYKLLKLWQSGILTRLRSVWAPQLKKCAKENSSGYTEVTIMDVAVAPIAVLVGFMLSVLLFIFELCWSPTLSPSLKPLYEYWKIFV